jgi:hypothetical protein
LHSRIALRLQPLRVGRDVLVFLARCEVNGVKFENCPKYIREWKEAFKQSLKSNRSGKILFQFGADGSTLASH